MRAVAVSLAGLSLALLFVGVVSGTVLRHLVQIVPIVAALLMTNRWPAVAASAAIPLFAFWTLIVMLIWMFLLGMSSIANGTYTLAEILATFVMAGCSVGGLVTSVPTSRGATIAVRLAVIGLFAVLQIAAMAISMMKAIANL